VDVGRDNLSKNWSVKMFRMNNTLIKKHSEAIYGGLTGFGFALMT